ncbi:MAG TPA: RIP metalloprotease RseP [Gammaproteobacteria bacterium]
MPEFLSSVIAFVVAISVLVAAHEYGHFWAARRLGFKVLRFSIGFGKPLWKWTGRDPDRVEYWLSSIPLGGYVKILDEREAPVEAHEASRAFNRRPIPQRIAVLLAGPAFNFLFALLAYWVLFITGQPGIRPIVDAVTPGSVAAESGLRAGDIITHVGGQATATLEDAVLAVYDELLADGVIDLRVQALDDEPRSVELDARDRVGELTEPDALFKGLGFTPGPGVSLMPVEIVTVDSGSAAETAGLRAGDRVLAVGGTSVQSWQQLVELIQPHPRDTVTIRVLRNGAEMEFPLTIGVVEENGVAVGRIGTHGRLPEDIAARIRAEQRYSVIDAIPRSIAKTWEMSAMTVRLLGHMLVGDVSLRSVSGPIMIADYAGESAAAGFTSFLGFLALVSISLGIMNLLPVPILDGGQIVFQVAEWLKGAPLSERALALGQQVGLALLIVLMSFVFYNDLTRIFGT